MTRFRPAFAAGFAAAAASLLLVACSSSPSPSAGIPGATVSVGVAAESPSPSPPPAQAAESTPAPALAQNPSPAPPGTPPTSPVQASPSPGPATAAPPPTAVGTPNAPSDGGAGTPAATPSPDNLVDRLKRSAKDALLRLVPDWKDQGRINILLLGIDKQDVTQGNTDVMMLASVDPATNSAMLISIPRHLCVNDCKTWNDRINAVAVIDGVESVKQSVAELLGVPVDFYASVN